MAPLFPRRRAAGLFPAEASGAEVECAAPHAEEGRHGAEDDRRPRDAVGQAVVAKVGSDRQVDSPGGEPGDDQQDEVMRFHRGGAEGAWGR